MNAHDRITRARAGLVLSAPFFATLALDMGATEVGDDVTKTMATDGASLFYNPAFVAECSDAELRGTIAHEVLHVAYLHHTRRGSRDPKLWNRAADYVINAALVAEGFTLPEGALLDSRFADMTTEQVYRALDDERPKDGQGKPAPDPGTGAGSGAGQFGDVLDAAPASDPAALQAAELAAKANVVNAATAAARMAGQGSALAARMLDDIRKPVVDWRAVLRRFVDDSSRRITTWTRPNRRHVAAGLYLPGTIPDGMSRLAVVVDVSGSIDKAALAAFLGELNAAVDDVQPDAVDVIQCDTKVTARQTFEAGDAVTVNIVGGGGTDMTPALREVRDAAACIVFTDCEFGRAPFDPGVPVLWARWGGGGTVPAFGELVDIAA